MSNDVRTKYAMGKTGRTIVGRLLPGTDLITGIEEICRENGIKYASIETCYGSFQKAAYLYLIPKEESLLGAGYGDINHEEGPVEFLTGTGTVCQRDGDYETHFHGTMCDKVGRVFGGHMIKGKNPALGTVDLVINEVEGLKMHRRYDEETKSIQLDPEQL